MELLIKKYNLKTTGVELVTDVKREKEIMDEFRKLKYAQSSSSR